MFRLGEPVFRLRSWLMTPTRRFRARANLLDVAVILFALWTVASHLTVILHGNLFVLLAIFCACLGLSVGLVLHSTRHTAVPAGVRLFRALTSGEEPGTWLASDDLTPMRLGAWPLVLSAAVLCCAYWYNPSPLLLWVGGISLMLIAALRLRFGELQFVPCGNRRWQDITVWAMVGVCTFIVLMAHRQSSDDTFYVNIAVSIVDQPSRAILQYNTMVGVPGLEMHLPIYKAHSYEVLAGLVAWATPLSALQVCHLLFPSIAAVLLMFVVARFAMLLVGRHWLWCSIVVLLYLVLEGSAYSGYSNHALVRFQHGKAVFVSIWLPLLLCYTLEYTLRPSRRGWWLLLAGQIGCVGLSGTAIWMAPLCVGFCLISTWRPNWLATRTAVVGALSSLYLVAVGLWLREEMKAVYDPGRARHSGALAPDAPAPPPDLLLGEAMTWALGSYEVQAVLMFCALVAWSACRPGSLGQRFALLYSLSFFLIALNPLLAEPIRSVAAFYWRVFWLLPLPMLVGVLATGAFRLLKGRARHLAPAAALIGATGVLIWVPDIHAVHKNNAVRFRWLKPNVPGIYQLAEDVNRIAGPGSYVLAPEDVSVWMTVMEGHAYPLATKPKYLRTQSSMTREEAGRREALMRYVRGLEPKLAEGQSLADFEKQFPRALVDYDLEAVCVYNAGPYIETLKKMLKKAGYAPVKSRSRHTVWKREPATTTEGLGRLGTQTTAFASAG